MSDLGNRGSPNSMKLDENIDLDELLLDPVLFVFVLSPFCFFRGSYSGVSEYKNNMHMRGNFQVPIHEMEKVHSIYNVKDFCTKNLL